MIGKRQLIGNVNNVIPYIMSHNSTNILCKGLSDLNIVKRVYFIGEEAKGHAYRYFKIMEESINLAFHACVVIESIAIKIAEFRGVPF